MVWAIGKEAFCKENPWKLEMESENETIAFVRKIAPDKYQLPRSIIPGLNTIDHSSFPGALRDLL